MKALVDADMVVFKAGMAGEERFYHVYDGEGQLVNEIQYIKDIKEWTAQQPNPDEYVWELQRVASPLSHVLANAKAIMRKATEFADEYRVFIAGKGNYRYDIYPCYKGHRRDGLRPLQEEDVRNYLIKYWGAELVNDEEADDVVSYLQCAAPEGTTYIASCDKDLRNTPGWLYNWDKMDKPEWITQEQADLNFYRQLLTGDSTDNIPGLKGWGPKKAEKLLPEWTAETPVLVADAYQEMYGDDWLEVINMNGQLLWMRRSPEQIWRWDDA